MARILRIRTGPGAKSLSKTTLLKPGQILLVVEVKPIFQAELRPKAG
jgi:hypothetical protein